MQGQEATATITHSRIFEGGTGLLVLQQHPDIKLPDLAAIHYPETVVKLHSQYSAAGADTLKTLTFNANPATLENDISLCQQLCRLGVDQCHAAGAKTVAGNIGCTLPPDFPTDKAFESFRIQASELIKAGADLLLVETIYDIPSARYCLTACREAISTSAKAIPLYINAVFPKIHAEELTFLAKEFNCQTIGWNCSQADETLLRETSRLKQLCPDTRILLQPDGNIDPVDMLASGLKSKTIDMAGGCCGTTPDTIFRLHRQITDIQN